jgi:glucokinase
MGRYRGAGVHVIPPFAIGIDAGGTNVKGAAVDVSGHVIARRLTIAAGRDLPGIVREIADDLVRDAGRRPVAFGLAAPGIASIDGRSIWWMQGRRDEVQGLDWAVHLGWSEPVRVLNDAHAALLAEVWQGAAQGCANVILVTLGTGVGGAAIVDGRLLRGHLNRAGHLGHISLDPAGVPDIVHTPGSLEEAIGDCSVHRRSHGRFRSTAELMAADDEDARAIWSASVRALACGLASLINVLDPERVILGGGIVAAGDRLFAPLRAELADVEWRPHGRAVEIVAASAGEYAGAVGAAYHAMRTDHDAAG